MTEVFGALVVDDEVHVRRTVSESDVYLFAGLTGDLNANHVDAVIAAGTSMGARVAHGALMLGFVSTASTSLIERSGVHAVAYGYDRVRFVKPVFFGDTVDVGYCVVSLEESTRKLTADVTITNQRDEVVAVTQHLLFFPEGT